MLITETVEEDDGSSAACLPSDDPEAPSRWDSLSYDDVWEESGSPSSFPAHTPSTLDVKWRDSCTYLTPPTPQTASTYGALLQWGGNPEGFHIPPHFMNVSCA